MGGRIRICCTSLFYLLSRGTHQSIANLWQKAYSKIQTSSISEGECIKIKNNRLQTLLSERNEKHPTKNEEPRQPLAN